MESTYPIYRVYQTKKECELNASDLVICGELGSDVVVYGLTDPRHPDAIRYIGATSGPFRFGWTSVPCVVEGIGFYATIATQEGRDWVQQLSDDGVQPLAVVLEKFPEENQSCDYANGCARENHWREVYRAQGGLLNPTVADVEEEAAYNAAAQDDAARARENVEGEPEGVAEYVEHEFALREYEGEKLNRLKIMTWAQSVRTRFLKLSMADRKIFLDVLTADEGGSMSRMFALQAAVEANGCDDDQLAITAAVNRLVHRENSYPDAYHVVREQRHKKERKERLLASSSLPELPAGRALNLLEGHHE